MIGLKKMLIKILSATILLISCLMLLVCTAYILTDGIEFSINEVNVEFEGLTYGILKQFDVQPNEMFVIMDDDEQVDITKCECNNNDTVESITVVVANTKSICDFAVYGIHVGDNASKVKQNMPRETKHIVDTDTGVMISEYVDKDHNVLIVGTDTDLNIVSYVTIRVQR